VAGDDPGELADVHLEEAPSGNETKHCRKIRHVATARLDVTRAQVLSFRRTVQALDERLPPGAASLRRAAWAGVQDSMPRAALLSIHARVEGTRSSTWEDPSLVQVWGPRFSAFVVARQDVAVFTLGRHPDDPKARGRAEGLADRLDAFLAGRTMTYGEAGHAMGVHPNELRYATTTGRILIRWEGARQPTIWMIPPPGIAMMDARLELIRRHLQVFGPATPESFSTWAGVKPPRSIAAFAALGDELMPVRTPIGDGWVLKRDEPAFRAPGGPAAPARLLPSGDSYFLLQGADRELLVPDADRRGSLWTSRVWPGAVLVRGEVAGTWRRAGADVSIGSWRRFDDAERAAIEGEAASLPLPDLRGPIRVRWGG